MASTNTGVKFQVIETNNASQHPFKRGQFIIQDDGKIFYDPTTGMIDDYGSNKQNRLELIKENKFIEFALNFGENSINSYLSKVENPQIGDKLYFTYYDGSVYVNTGRQFTENGWAICNTPTDATYIKLDNDEVYLSLLNEYAIDNDICCISHLINGTEDKYENSLYIFYENKWHLLTDKYNAKNVYFDEDIKTTINIEGVELDKGVGTLSTKGKNLLESMQAILCPEKIPDVKQPTVTIILKNASTEIKSNRLMEVGTPITAIVQCKLDSGSYEFGPTPTGVTFANGVISLSNDYSEDYHVSHINTSISKDFGLIHLQKDKTLQASFSVEQSEGSKPYKLLNGKYIEYKDKQINSKIWTNGEVQSKTITPYIRGLYWGFSKTNVLNKEDITSDLIRNNTSIAKMNSIEKHYKSIKSQSFTIESDTRTIILACPKEAEITSILNTTVNAEMKNAFTKLDELVSVAGATGSSTSIYAHQYKVWLYSPEFPYEKNTNFTVTLS